MLWRQDLVYLNCVHLTIHEVGLMADLPESGVVKLE